MKMKIVGIFEGLCAALIAALLVSNIVHAHDGKTHGDQIAGIDQAAITAPPVVSKKKTVWGKNYFPNPTLITQDGEKVRFFDDMIKDKVVAINFIFTSCVDSCPLETARLKQVRDILGERVGHDIFLYSISIDPVTDTAAVLKAYKKKFSIDDDWTFLTGDEAEITNLRIKLGLYLDGVDNNESDPDDHNLSLIIGNQATGRWMKRSPFEDPYILASQLSDWLHNWKTAALTKNNYADAPKLRQIVTPGEKIFRTRCRSCHKIGKDGGIGPDLLGVTRNRDHAWLSRWLKEPDKMLAEGEPLATSLFNQYKIPMPNMRLSDKDVADIIEYIAGETERLM